MKQLFAVMKKEIRCLQRDKFMLRILVIFPVLQLLVLGYAVTFETKRVAIEICDMDKSSYSRHFIQKVITNDRFDFVGYTDDVNKLDRDIKQWKTKIGLYFPPDFSEKLIRNGRASVLTYLDAIDGNQALTAFGYLQRIALEQSFQLIPKSVLRQHIKEDRIVSLTTHFLFNPDLKNDAFMVPGVVVMLLTIVTSLMGALTLVKEKEAGTLEHIMVTPIRKSHLIAGKLLPYLIYAFIEIAVLIKLAQIIFSINFIGSYLTLYFITALFLFTTTGIGLIVSTLSQTQQQALFLSWFFIVFSSMLSGFFIPISNMPHWLQIITYINPMRYMMTSMRELFLKGTPLRYLVDQIVPLALLGASLFTVSVFKFKKKLS